MAWQRGSAPRRASLHPGPSVRLALCGMPVPHQPRPPIASRQDLCFSKVVSKCTSFVIVSQAFETTMRNGISCLGDLSSEQTRARQTHLLPLIVQKSISYLRIWVRPRRRPAPHSPHRRRRRP